MIHTNKIFIATLIFIIIITSFPFLNNANAATLYYYKKYELIVNEQYDDRANFYFDKYLSLAATYFLNSGRTGYTIDTKTGIFTLTGSSISSEEFHNGTTVYTKDSDHKIYRYEYNSGKSKTAVWEGYSVKDGPTVYEKGSYITTIIAPYGSYPSNGRSGSYWYVVGGVVNNNPTINITTSDNQLLSENEGFNKLIISGTVRDQDNGDSLSIKYTIKNSLNNPLANHNNQIIQSGVIANGSNQSFDNLTIDIDSSITEGNYTLTIWAEDNKGGKSTNSTINFIVDKTGPSIHCSKRIVVPLNSYVKINISATDPANPLNNVPVNYRSSELNVNNNGIFNVSTDKIFINPNSYPNFSDGEEIIFNVEAIDTVGNITVSDIKIQIDSSGLINPNEL